MGKATSTVVLGGGAFRLSAPIIIGNIVSLSGSFDRAFIVAGLLALVGAVAIFLPKPPADPPMLRRRRRI